MSRATHDGDLRPLRGLVLCALPGGLHDSRRVCGLRRDHGALRGERGGPRGRDRGDGVRGPRGRHYMWLPAALRLLSVDAVAFCVP